MSGPPRNNNNSDDSSRQAPSSLSRSNLLAPSKTNFRPGLNNGAKDDQSMQRYLLTEPADVFPLPDQTTNGSKCEK